LIAKSGNTGISEAPHLHYEERLSDKPVDPGAWLGCSSGKLVTYDGLQRRVNQKVGNEGYACLGVGAGQKPTPGDGLRALVGTWSGVATQNRVAPFTIVVSLRSPVAASVGVTEIPASGCVGSVRYRRTEARVHQFSMTWQKGNCLAGVMSLRVLDQRTLGYSWEGHFSDGTHAASSARLKRIDKLTFLAPATSRYSDAYWADVTGAKRTAAGLVAISFSANGRSDLRRPESSCLIHNATGEKAPVHRAALSEDRPGRYAGELEFIPYKTGVWSFRYSCQTDYTSVPVIRLGP
jgi:hypothetical protein